MSAPRLLPLLLVAAVVVACTDGASRDDAVPSPTSGGSAETTTTRPSCPHGLEPAAGTAADPGPAEPADGFDAVIDVAGPGVLDVGVLLPATGELTHLAPAQRAGIELALEDVNAAGGVLGGPVTLSLADSGGPGDGRAPAAARRLLDAGVDAIVGTASEGTTLEVIGEVTGAGVVLISPHNNAPAFTDHPDEGRYFRTAPSDVLQARALAGLVADDGARRVAVISRGDGYGGPILSAFEAAATDSGLEVAAFTYRPTGLAPSGVVDRALAGDPDAVVVIGLLESAQILDALAERARGPRDLPTYGVAGNLGDRLADVVADADVLACMRGILPGAPTPATLRRRLVEHDPALVDPAHAAEAYDAVVITALAAELAGTDTGSLVAEAIPRVTRDGRACAAPAACLELLRDPDVRGADDIDYEGAAGPHEFSAAGEPTVARFRVVQFDADGNLAQVGRRTAPSR